MKKYGGIHLGSDANVQMEEKELEKSHSDAETPLEQSRQAPRAKKRARVRHAKSPARSDPLAVLSGVLRMELRTLDAQVPIFNFSLTLCNTLPYYTK